MAAPLYVTDDFSRTNRHDAPSKGLCLNHERTFLHSPHNVSQLTDMGGDNS